MTLKINTKTCFCIFSVLFELVLKKGKYISYEERNTLAYVGILRTIKTQSSLPLHMWIINQIQIRIFKKKNVAAASKL